MTKLINPNIILLVPILGLVGTFLGLGIELLGFTYQNPGDFIALGAVLGIFIGFGIIMGIITDGG